MYTHVSCSSDGRISSDIWETVANNFKPVHLDCAKSAFFFQLYYA